MLADNEVEVTGVFEPDPEQRIQLEHGGRETVVGSQLVRRSIGVFSTIRRSRRSRRREATRRAWTTPTPSSTPESTRSTTSPRVTITVASRASSPARKRSRCLSRWAICFGITTASSGFSAGLDSGVLGHVFSVRAHISTSIPNEYRAALAEFKGGVFYDLAGHVIDLVVYILGRPKRGHVVHAERGQVRSSHPRQHSQRLRVRHGSGIHRHSGDGSAADGKAFRGLRHGRIGDHGALRAGRYASTVPAGAKGGISGRSIDI